VRNLYVCAGGVAGYRLAARKELGNEAAADADSLFAELLGPDPLEAYADGRKNGHVENGEKSVGNDFGEWKIQGYAAKAEIHDSGAMGRLVGQDRISVGADHGDAFGLAGHGKDTRFFRSEGKCWMGGLQRRDLRGLRKIRIRNLFRRLSGR
jgi:hypothetical protein